jgi:hypothetical protein
MTEGAEEAPLVSVLDTVDRFLARYDARDFDGLAECFSATDFHRTGPYGDTIDSAATYVAFLRDVVPTLGDRYRLVPQRVFAGDGGTAVAELIEEYEVDGELRRTPEVILFDGDADGRITRMRLYVQRVHDFPPAGGRAAMGHRD